MAAATADYDPHAPLRRDVKRLGAMLGDTVRELEGDDVYQAVERVRRASKAARGGDEAAARALHATLDELPVDDAAPVARAFAGFLTLANIAEQHHRTRRRRDYMRDPDAPPQRGSLAETIQRLRDAGIPDDAIDTTLHDTHIELVLTAHPTEITRRTVLAKQQRIAARLDALDRPDLAPSERTELQDGLRNEIAALWATRELRRERPEPEDEAKGAFAVIEKVLWDALPAHVRALDAVRRHLVGDPLPLDAAPVTFGSWMGGDRDGNPRVTPETTARVVWLARWMAVDLYVREVDALRDELSMDAASAELVQEAGSDTVPYRALLRRVRDRLHAMRDRYEARLEDPLGPAPSAGDHPDLGADELDRLLRLCHASLVAVGLPRVADGRLLDVIRRVAAFGLHLVRLDIRQESTRHRDALDAVTRAMGRGSYTEWDEAARMRFLREALGPDASPLPHPPAAGMTAEVRDVFDTCAAIAALPRDAFGAYVISMATAPSDVLAVLALQKMAGVTDPLRTVPLFETRADLDAAPASMQALLDEPTYRAHVGDRPEVMIGYSDSAKDAGILSASWALYRAQQGLVAACERAGARVTLFHGRGGTVGRGGGPAHAAITGLPRGAVAGRLRVTEQGEVIHARFGLPGIALRSLELYASAVLEATLTPPAEPRPEWHTLMDHMATTAEAAYRDVISGPDFVPYFRAVTPEQELGWLNIGSRPAKRRPEGGLESLRAIPWVFAWTQNRLIVPAWLGLGEGLRAGLDHDAKTLGVMQREWPFLRNLVDLVEMGLAKADRWVARVYHDALAPEPVRHVGDDLFRRFDDTVETVLGLTGHARLVAHNTVLRRSIDVRNPYVDPLNLLQIKYLERVRASDTDPDPRWLDALLVTMNGVAQGMRNTG